MNGEPKVPKVIHVTGNHLIELSASDLAPVFEAFRQAGVVEIRGLRISKRPDGYVLDGLHELPAVTGAA